MKKLIVLVCLSFIFALSQEKEINYNSGTFTKMSNESINDSLNVEKDSLEIKTAKKKIKQKAEDEYYTGQCQGITKKGKQCKRNASGGTRYCYQHGGK